MDKEDVIYIYTHTYTWILLSRKKELKFSICDNLNGPWRHYAKWNKLKKDKYNMTSLI